LYKSVYVAAVRLSPGVGVGVPRFLSSLHHHPSNAPHHKQKLDDSLLVAAYKGRSCSPSGGMYVKIFICSVSRENPCLRVGSDNPSLETTQYRYLVAVEIGLIATWTAAVHTKSINFPRSEDGMRRPRAVPSIGSRTVRMDDNMRLSTRKLARGALLVSRTRWVHRGDFGAARIAVRLNFKTLPPTGFKFLRGVRIFALVWSSTVRSINFISGAACS
jgi:hypothetical protein